MQDPIFARLARIATRVDPLLGSDAYRINGLVSPVKEWREATGLKYAPPPRPVSVVIVVIVMTEYGPG